MYFIGLSRFYMDAIGFAKGLVTKFGEGGGLQNGRGGGT